MRSQTNIKISGEKEGNLVFIGPESDHCLLLSLTDSLTNSLTNSCLVNLIDVTLACENTNSKLVEIVTLADVDTEDHLGNNLLIWELEFVQHFAADVL